MSSRFSNWVSYAYLALCFLEFDAKRKSFLDITCPDPKCLSKLDDEQYRKVQSVLPTSHSN